MAFQPIEQVFRKSSGTLDVSIVRLSSTGLVSGPLIKFLSVLDLEEGREVCEEDCWFQRFPEEASIISMSVNC